MSRVTQDGIRYLARGGVVLPSSVGPIQYGVVPETIKDTIESTGGVPKIFVVPDQLFSAERFISMAELEFPAYWNHFCKGVRTTIVCRHDQKDRLSRILSEAVFGPHSVDSKEFNGRLPDSAPDLVREMAHFRWLADKKRPMRMDDIFEFVEFDPDGHAHLPEDVRIVHDGTGLTIVEKGKTRTRFHGEPPVPYTEAHPDHPRISFRLPLFGVTVIGSGHGFDPGNRNSGFIIWIDGSGVLVDPPVDALEWLAGYDVGSRQLDSLILTHCHADHDAGTLQKLLQEGRITIYTTDTIMSSFVAKYSHLTNVEPAAFRRLFDHIPVRAGEPLSIHGAHFTFRYSLHSIPCIGFEATFRGKGLVYPSDTLNEPEIVRGLRDKGVLTQERARDLINFPWHHELILHEAGIPPIHTPSTYLAGLEDAIKKRLWLVHVSARGLPPDSGLKIAPTGLEHTVDLHATHGASDSAVERLEAMSRVDILAELPVARGVDFLRAVHKEHHRAGAKILATGTPGDKFYIVLSGQVETRPLNGAPILHSEFDYFGQTSCLTNGLRRHDVFAKTDVTLLTLEKADFLNLLRGTDLKERLENLARLRTLPTWELLGSSPVFSHLTDHQKTQLQSLMEPVEFKAGDFFGHEAMIVASGRVSVTRDGEQIASIRRGGFVGDVHHIRAGTHSRLVFTCVTKVSGYQIKNRALKGFFKNNPGVYIRLLETSLLAPPETPKRTRSSPVKVT